jgi:hypothetical protein
MINFESLCAPRLAGESAFPSLGQRDCISRLMLYKMSLKPREVISYWRGAGL